MSVSGAVFRSERVGIAEIMAGVSHQALTDRRRFSLRLIAPQAVHRQLNRRNVRMIDRWRRQAEALFYAVDSSAYHRGSLVAFAFADIRPVKRVHF